MISVHLFTLCSDLHTEQNFEFSQLFNNKVKQIPTQYTNFSLVNKF